MRTASILLALVVVLGFVSEAGAENVPQTHNFTISVGGQYFGFVEWGDKVTFMCVGSLDSYEVPFTATQGLIGFCVILAMLVIVPAVLTVRWKKKRAAQ